MNKKLVSLKKDRRDLQAKAGAILEKDSPDQNDLVAYDAIEKQIGDIDALIDRHERHLARERDEGGAPDENVQPSAPRGDGGFASLGEQCMAVIKAAQSPNSVDKRLLQVGAASGMNEALPAEGGFWIRKQTEDAVLQRMYSTGQIASRVRRITIGPGSNGVTLKRVDEDSRVDGSRWGGITSYWAGEGTAKTPSMPKFADEDMKLMKIIAYVQLTNELMADAVALDSFLSQAFPEELQFRAEQAILTGDGAGKPLGVTKSGAVIAVLRSGGAGTLTSTDVLAQWSRLWTGSVGNSIFTHSQDILPKLYGMTMGAGGNVTPIFLPPGGSVAAGPSGSLFGRPLVPTEFNPKLSTAGDLLLCDLSQYVVIEKGGVQQAASIHVKFLEDEMTLRFTYRMNGQPWWKKALTPANGSTDTQSPFVAIATA